MRIMAAHAACCVRDYPLMEAFQSRWQNIVTISADAGVSLFGFAQLRSMWIMAGSTITFNCRHVTDPILPVLVDIMTTEAEPWPLLEQVTGFIVTVGIMADSAVLVTIRGALWRSSVLMAGDTQVLCIISQHKR